MVMEIKVPEVGESINEGIIVEWFKAEGDYVNMEEPLFDLETDKVTMSVVAEHEGVLSIKVEAGETVQVGQVVGTIDTEAKASAGAEKSEPKAEAPAETAPAPEPEPAKEKPVEPEAKPEPEPKFTAEAGLDQLKAKMEGSAEAAPLSPAVRRLVEEHSLNPAAIAASGKDGRLTKEDVLRHVSQPPAAKATQAAEPPKQVAPVPQVAKAPAASAPKPAGDTPRQTRKPMTPLRQRIAQRLVDAQQTAAILTTFNEVDMSNLMDLRKRYKDMYKEKYGINLGFMSFFLKASVDALKTVPKLNAQIEGDEIVENHFYDIGVAVGSERGLVVPVVRDVDQLSFADVEKEIARLAGKVRTKTIQLNELSGGCFTVSNGGVYGSLLSTPILNPPQSGILGMHGIKKRPVVVDDEIVIRPMMYLALSYDHRIVDGSEAVGFLKRIVSCIENPERMMLEV